MKRRQCKTCPWKVSTDLASIPRYDPALHAKLASTIATPGSCEGISGDLRWMACHARPVVPCVGWLHHQLGPGGNIPLRLRVARNPSLAQVTVVGAQHVTFDNTLRRPR